MRHSAVIALIIACVLSQIAGADVVEFEEQSNWEAAVGEFTTIHFDEVPPNTVLTEEYSDLGAHFHASCFTAEVEGFNDGHGIKDDGAGAWVTFDEPLHWVATDYAGDIHIDLYRDGELIYESGGFAAFTFGFAGLLSDEPFDGVLMYDIGGFVSIDDLHFGPPIPAAPALALLAIAGLAPGRRRRCT